jgi:hypothetical protein
MPWAQFVAGLGPCHRFDVADKKKVPMFSPAEFKPGLPRIGKNVVRVWFGVLDLDMVTADQLAEVCGKLEGLDAVLYTSWRHPLTAAQGLWRVRVCVRLSRPIEPPEWPSFWLSFSAHFCGLNDPSDKDINRCYFGPSAPPGTDPRLCHFVTFQGGPLQVDTITDHSFGRSTASKADKVTRERLERLAQRWKKSRDGYRSELGEMLAKLCKGLPYADAGNRDNATFQLCQDLAKELPDADHASIAAHFAQSLQVMPGRDAITEADVIAKLERAAEKVMAETLAQEQIQIAEGKLRIRQAFAHIDPERDYPYRETELDAMALTCACTREELRKRWVIQRRTTFYVLGPGGTYSPAYSDKDVGNAILRDLAPAVSAGVDLWTQGQTGESVRKGLPAIMGEFGSVATDYVQDLRAQVARYDASQRTFIDAPCPLRPLTPAYDQDVADWLSVAMGDNLPDVLNWIAQVTNLDQICAALMLTGAPGIGKTLLALGLSRLWTTNQPTDLDSALGDWNDSISRCPLILADEQLPKDWRGHGRTAELRQFIAARSRPFKKRYHDEGTIIGAIRLIITGNNEDMLGLSEHLTAHDIEAIGDRFYHVRVRPEAGEFLTMVDTARLVQGEGIARHALWLRDNYPVQRNGRFLVKSPDREFYRGLATRAGIRSAVLQWLIGYLKSPGRIDTRGDLDVRVKDGGLYVKSQAVLDSWAIYVTNEPVPPTGKLAQAIGELSTKREHLTKPGGKSAHYRLIDPDHLHAWAKQTGFAEREEIDQALSVDTETRIRALIKVPGM